ncbi:MAG: GNAT family N-acetyltransferase [Caulobacterales bacterium]|nr:GNAT family N-acetyltransferase [Caulobacterales bacterium]
MIDFADAGLTLRARTSDDTDRAELAAGTVALFDLFLRREHEFGFNPDVVVEYPDLEPGPEAPFLAGVVAYVEGRIAELEASGPPIARVVILTTYGPLVGPALQGAGWDAEHIDMPAGPDGTWTYRKDLRAEGRTLYIEAVNEADEKLRPDFLLELTDDQGRLRGGAWGAIHDRDGARYAYIATMTLDVGLKPGVGTRLGEALHQTLAEAGVVAAHLGTQTAGPFYERLGFRITHRVLPELRVRTGEDGARVTTDLVMMERRLG